METQRSYRLVVVSEGGAHGPEGDLLLPLGRPGPEKDEEGFRGLRSRALFPVGKVVKARNPVTVEDILSWEREDGVLADPPDPLHPGRIRFLLDLAAEMGEGTRLSGRSGMRGDGVLWEVVAIGERPQIPHWRGDLSTLPDPETWVEPPEPEPAPPVKAEEPPRPAARPAPRTPPRPSVEVTPPEAPAAPPSLPSSWMAELAVRARAAEAIFPDLDAEGIPHPFTRPVEAAAEAAPEPAEAAADAAPEPAEAAAEATPEHAEAAAEATPEPIEAAPEPAEAAPEPADPSSSDPDA